MAIATGTGLAIAGGLGAAGAVGSAALRRGGGGGGVAGQAPRVEVVRLPTFDFTEPRFRQLSDFVQQQFESISRGEPPLFFQKQLPLIRRGLEEQLQQTFFGRPGERTGIVPSTLEASAITGTGGAAGNRQVAKRLRDFAEQSRRIEEFIAQQTVGATQQSIRDVATIGLNIPQGPPSQAVVLGGFAPQAPPSVAGPVGQLFSSAAQLAAQRLQKGGFARQPGAIDFRQLPSNLIGTEVGGRSVVGFRTPAQPAIRDSFQPPASFFSGPPAQFS